MSHGVHSSRITRRLPLRSPLRMAAVAVLVGVLGMSIAAPSVSAATPNPAAPAQGGTQGNGQALEIAPPLVTLTVDPGQTVQTQVSLRDVSSGSLVVTAQANDFVAAGEDGTPKIMLKDEPNPYSLKGWVAPMQALTLKPREIKNLPVTLRVPADAAPGGHYGVIRFTATPPELHGTGVSLSTSLGALMFVTVKGDAKENLAVKEFSVNHDGKTGSLFESTPLHFVERLKNDGNVHEQPNGQVTITDMFGKKIGAVNVNLPPRVVLPGSTRKFEQTLDASVLGTRKLFGRYHADLKLTYADGKQTLTQSLVFWVIPYKLIALAVIVLVGGFFLLRTMIKRYNQRIITKAQGGQTSAGGSAGGRPTGKQPKKPKRK